MEWVQVAIQGAGSTFAPSAVALSAFVVYRGGARIAFRLGAALAVVFAIKLATGKASFPNFHATVAAFVATCLSSVFVFAVLGWAWALAVAAAQVKQVDAFDVLVGIGIGVVAARV